MMKRFIDYIDRYQMITKEDIIIAGISGGPDSVCLFFVLLELRRTRKIPFIAVHVNHTHQGSLNDGYEAYVENLCREYDVPYQLYTVDMKGKAREEKLSLEEAGRILRKEAFADALRKYHGTKVALAHQENDNAETFLWNAVRGSDLRGLCGVAPVNGIYIRPLLWADRQLIEEFLKERGVSWCVDPSNEETHYTRNKIRHLVLPVLKEEVNEKAVHHISETAQSLCELDDYLEQETTAVFDQVVDRSEPDGALILKEAEYKLLHPYMKKRVIYRAMETIAGRKKDISRPHVEAMEQLFDRQTGRRIDLPYEMEAVRVYEGIFLGKKKEQSEEPHAEWKLKVPGQTVIGDLGITVNCELLTPEMYLEKRKTQKPGEKGYTKWFDYAIIKRLMCIRNRRAGDFLVIHSSGQRQKLKSYLINEKIPAVMRKELLLLAAEDEVFWIVGYRTGCSYPVTEQTEKILQIELLIEGADRIE